MIEFHRLSKTYSDVKALDDVSFTVPAGSVTGFLGPNGAGKSTAMRILAGLSRPTSGSATVLGRPYAELERPGYDVGTLLDASAQHPGRTGREVLTLGTMMLGLPRTRVDEVLELVGLTGKEGRRPVGGYSLGMRQRLGIGHALLGRPRALILDEPANGLDPQGIHWMRGLLRDLARSGCAVLLSSHLLHEVEQVADRIVMIGRGRLLAQGTPAELGRGRSLEQTFLELTAAADRGLA
ncbi:ATP-binding cassette domain-containing protein [Nonomuraea sp. KC401]|uniref:ABC transporter ATP-binding protein n=1 Tax=unclassified Nonomuraea TaxID=2593643 RepID=UPI0010FED01B|nr:ATP-binding cassette domain-containing protein [Nonomuraea sp. KC401]NBE92719.1 ATP-binding cassette domain-containing protein [Nonomuraea sp. K271]TLF60496.1 ATP-binding cassette domain-containing protein [Nonomuraea sp. KC401]